MFWMLSSLCNSSVANVEGSIKRSTVCVSLMSLWFCIRDGLWLPSQGCVPKFRPKAVEIILRTSCWKQTSSWSTHSFCYVSQGLPCEQPLPPLLTGPYSPVLPQNNIEHKTKTLTRVLPFITKYMTGHCQSVCVCVCMCQWTWIDLTH